MKSDTQESIEHKEIDTVSSDCKRWRRLVSQCAEADDLVPPSTEEQYKVIHGRILATCRHLADEESVPESRRHIALELDELLRPWSSTKTLQEAPPKIVSDLVKYQAVLGERLRGKRRNVIGQRLRKLILPTCLAALGGISVFLFLQSTSSNPSTPLFQLLQGLLTDIAGFLGRTTFTEQFAIAVVFSWLFGIWLLSKLSRN
jgi:hypothetical protein